VQEKEMACAFAFANGQERKKKGKKEIARSRSPMGTHSQANRQTSLRSQTRIHYGSGLSSDIPHSIVHV